MRLIQPPLRQFILVQSQIVPKFMQKSRPHFRSKNHVIRIRKIPEVFQKQNDL